MEAWAQVTQRLRALTLDDVALVALPVSVAFVFVRLLKAAHKRRTTHLKGPARTSYLFGVTKDIFTAPDIGVVYKNWEKLYGPVYEVPVLMGNKVVVLCDPKAVAHSYAKDTFAYQQPAAMKSFIVGIFGGNLLVSEGEEHKRQRRALSPAFSVASIRRMTPVFYNSSYCLKAAWDSSFQAASSDSVVIDVQQWMNYVSLDSVGAGGFAHDFGSLKGNISPVAAAFDSFGSVKPSATIMVMFLLAQVFPFIGRIPNARVKLFYPIRDSVAEIAGDLLDKARVEKAASNADGAVDKSIVGSLVKSETASSKIHMTIEEIRGQNMLLTAGYETTAISLTWALIELSRNPEVQSKLREELSQFTTEDPTYEQLTNGLPYLDAVVTETLRLHPPVPETTREVHQDDVIPLTNPIEDANGNLIDSIFIAKGSTVRVPIRCLNRSELLWGETAKEFLPSRWLDDGISELRAAEIQGHRHLLTFVDGPRTCLGKAFALTEFKAVLSVLIRSFSFELPGGHATKIENHRSILVRPKVAGQPGAQVPLIIRRTE